MRASWFPIPVSQWDDEEFQKLTPIEKLYYWTLMSQFNMDRQFYKPDLWYAAALKASEIKIRQARKKFERLGWIEITSGKRAGGKNLATTYKGVKWSSVPDEGEENRQFIQFRRYVFDMLLHLVRRGTLSHVDISVYMCCYAWRWWHQKLVPNEGQWTKVSFITKEQLHQMTGSSKPVISKSMNTLSSKSIFNDSSPLFKYNDGYTKYQFTEWHEPADPSDNENSAKLAREYEQEIETEVNRVRAVKESQIQKKAQLSGQILKTDLHGIFLKLHIQMLGHQCQTCGTDKLRLAELAKHFDAENIAKAMHEFIRVGVSQKKSGMSLTSFLNHAHELMSFKPSKIQVELPAEWLFETFECLYSNRFGERPVERSSSDKQGLINAGRSHGVERVIRALDEYINESLKLHISGGYKLYGFLRNIEVFLAPDINWDELSSV